LKAAGGMAAWRAQQAAQPQVSMQQYHMQAGPCFHVDAKVQLASGEQKRCADIKQNDVVTVPALPGRAASTARVECVVFTEMRGGVASLCTLGDSALRVTPYHPVHVGGKWQFPCDLARVVDSQPCPAVVSFLLRDCAPALVVDNVPVAALAHGLTDNDVIAHAFFGTHCVVDSLRRLRGFKEGRVVLHSDNALIRDQTTGLVIGLQQR